nr:MAG TPA: hypothetical protein [Caudoviricetes sp.]
MLSTINYSKRVKTFKTSIDKFSELEYSIITNLQNE